MKYWKVGKQHDLVLKLDKSQTTLRNFSDKLRYSKHGYSAVFDKENVVDQEKRRQDIAEHIMPHFRN